MRFNLFFLFLFSPAWVSAQFGSGKLVYYSGGSSYPEIIQAADLDKDGDIDVLMRDTNLIFWLSNDGSGTFIKRSELPESSSGAIVGLQAFDFDHDGDTDVVAAYEGLNKVYLWRNSGTGAFSSRELLASFNETIASLTVADTDKDGDHDIIVAMEYSQSHWIRNEHPSNQWSVMPLEIAGEYSDYIEVTDMNDDGTLDYISIADNRPQSIRLNNEPVSENKIGHARFIKAVDLDRDGDLDIVAGVNNYNEGLLWLENKAGMFTTHVISNSSNSYQSLTMFDFDNDGDEDIIAACNWGCNTHLFENLGAGNFNIITGISSGSIEDQALIYADFNGDNAPDLLKINSAIHTVVWYPNIAPQFTGLQADFVTGKTCQSAPVNFLQTSRGKNLTVWEWDFGDGTAKSNQQNPSHQYATTGTFIVRLKVINAANQTHEVTKNVEVITTLPAIDREYPLCDPELSVTLDPAYTYRWYSTPHESSFYREGNTMDFSGDITRYVKRTEIATGCSSATFEKISSKYYGYPGEPAVEGAVSVNGPATLTLQASGGENETVNWYADGKGESFIRAGSALTQNFNTTTTYYARMTNAGGCAGYLVPVTANIFNEGASKPEFTWADAGTSDSWTEATSVILDKDGNPAVYGLWTEGKVTAGETTLTSTLGYGNTFLIRYSKSGEPLGAIHITESENMINSYNHTILFDQSNNILLAANATSNLVVGGHSVVIPNDGHRYSIIAKLNPAGSLVWHHVVQAETVIRVDNSGDVHVIGSFRDNAITLGNITIPLSGYESGFVAKISQAGEVVYITETGASRYRAIAPAEDGSTYTAFTFSNSITLSGITLTDADNALAVAKYHTDGTLLWAKKVSQDMNFPIVQDMEFGSDGNLIMIGTFSPTFHAPTQTFFDIPLGSGGGGYIAKINPEGNALWVKRMLSADQLILNDISLSPDNTIYIVGSYSNRLVFDGQLLSKTGGAYSFAAKFDRDGINLWARDTDQRGIVAGAADQDGNLYVTGTFVDQTQVGEFNLTSNTQSTTFTNYNMVIAKIGTVFKSDFYTTPFCKGTPTSFHDISTASEGNAIVSRSWNFGDGNTSHQQNPVHNYNQAGVFTVTLTVNENTGATTTHSKQVIVSAEPEVTVTTEEGVLKATPGYLFYSWMKNGLSMEHYEADFKPREEGTYQVEVMNEAHCSTIVTVDFVMTGLNDEETSGINVFPNPFTRHIILTVTAPIGRVEIMDMMGRTIKVVESGFTEPITLDEISKGAYIVVVVSTPGKIHRRKILKN